MPKQQETHRAILPLSIIVPVLNAEEHLPALFSALANSSASEIVFVDGGSTDRTTVLLQESSNDLVKSAKGRGTQLATGAAATSEPWLLFLHADSHINCANWADVQQFISKADVTRASYFQLSFSKDSKASNLVSNLANWRARTFGMPYGDQGLLISRKLYEEVGGYRAISLMEDVDLVKRIGRKRLIGLDSNLVTSASRYQKSGWILRSLRNLSLLALFHMGVSPERLAKWYG